MIIYGIYQNCGYNGNTTSSSSFRNVSQKINDAFVSQQKANACGQSVEWIDAHKSEVNEAIMTFWRRHFKYDRNSGAHRFPKHLDWSLNDIEYKSLYICSPTDLEREAVNMLLDKDNFVRIRFGRGQDNMWNNRRIYYGNNEKRQYLSLIHI